MQQIKGAVLKSRMAFVEEVAGQDGVARVLAALPAAEQRILKLVFTSNWYPFPLGRALDEAIVQVLGGGRTDFFERSQEVATKPGLTAYDEFVKLVWPNVQAWEAAGADTSVVAKSIWRASTSRWPRLRYHPNATFLMYLRGLVPGNLYVRGVRRMMNAW